MSRDRRPARVFLSHPLLSPRAPYPLPSFSPPALCVPQAAQQYEATGWLDAAALPPAARDAMAPWRARAERRAEIDRDVQALRARALTDLAADQRSGG